MPKNIVPVWDKAEPTGLQARHYWFLANAIKAERDNAEESEPGGYADVKRATLDRLARSMADGLKLANPRFDPARFLDACGLPDFGYKPKHRGGAPVVPAPDMAADLDACGVRWDDRPVSQGAHSLRAGVAWRGNLR